MDSSLTPTPSAEWSADFSYAYLEKLYLQLKKKFRVKQLRDVPSTDSKTPTVFIRHDIDLSLDRALEMARWEKNMGVLSTYHVMLESPFYDPTSQRGRKLLLEMIALGHEVGLHYDPAGTQGKSEKEGILLIQEKCAQLEALLGQPVKSLSFHRPPAGYLSGPAMIADRVNAYGTELFKWYLSDSAGRWREGEPILSLAKPRHTHLQILVHPIWWGRRHLSARERMGEFIKQQSVALGLSAEAANEMLFDHAGVRGDI
jgi:hypothetical protein